MTWVIVIIVAFLIIGMFGISQKKSQVEKGMAENPQNYLLETKAAAMPKIAAIDYFIGHPDINEPIGVSLFKNDSELLITKRSEFDFENTHPLKLATISLSDIDDITIEDQTSIEKKVTVGRLLLTGIFALAWKKKKVNESAYLLVKWKQGKFTHETIFSASGKGSVASINTARNTLIKWVS